MAKVPSPPANGAAMAVSPDQGNDGHGCCADQIWKPFTKVDAGNIPELPHWPGPLQSRLHPIWTRQRTWAKNGRQLGTMEQGLL